MKIVFYDCVLIKSVRRVQQDTLAILFHIIRHNNLRFLERDSRKIEYNAKIENANEKRMCVINPLGYVTYDIHFNNSVAISKIISQLLPDMRLHFAKRIHDALDITLCGISRVNCTKKYTEHSVLKLYILYAYK